MLADVLNPIGAPNQSQDGPKYGFRNWNACRVSTFLFMSSAASGFEEKLKGVLKGRVISDSVFLPLKNGH